MESRTSIERRVRPGKTVSPRPTELKAWAYKEFEISAVFDLKTTTKKFNANDVEFGGMHPYVVRTSDNNGIKGFINEDTQYLNPGNTIAFGQDTATVFYQEIPYFTGDKIKVLSCKYDLNRRRACYFLASIRKAFSGFSWGVTSFNEKILKQIRITLPILKSGDIDFSFMEARIKEMEEARIKEMEEARIKEMDAYLTVAGFENCELTEEEKKAVLNLPTVSFKSFSIGSLFDINTGRDIIIGRVQDGLVPLISHQHDNNGISKRIKQLDYRILFDYKKTIPLADRGVFYATTQLENFHIGTRVKALTFKNGEQKELVRLFFVAAINKLQILFTEYLVNATDKLPALEIKLPVTSSDEIDYKFMELYIRAQEKLAIQRVKEWRAKEISTTKDIVEAESAGMQYAPHIQQDYLPKCNEDNHLLYAAEDIVVYGSIDVQLLKTKRKDLLEGKLELVLMYAIAPVARKKTEEAGKIALGIKEENLSVEAIKAYEGVEYVLFHYWKNSEAKPFKLASPTKLVSKADIPNGYMIRQEKDAKQFLLIEYNPLESSDIGEFDILKVQREGKKRYIPFVCKKEDIKL